MKFYTLLNTLCLKRWYMDIKYILFMLAIRNRKYKKNKKGMLTIKISSKTVSYEFKCI